VKLTTKMDELLLNKEIDIIVIATPVQYHYEIAKKALENDKHIWVEKPFTSMSSQAEELIQIAEKRKLTIFVDHTFIYTGAVKKIKELVEKKVLGDVIYFDSVRVNLGLFQHDVNVIWDLACHDLSIMDYLLNKKVVALTANGIANYYEHENIAHLALYFENNCFAHFHVNWTSPVKIRRVLIGGKNKMLLWDDMLPTEKIKVYDAGVEVDSPEQVHKILVQYRTGDMHSPKINDTEALALGVKEFLSSINENRRPLTNAYDGLKVVKILEAAEKSIKERGKLVEINGF
ncbi:MAG: Gfo/Idh/MocA family oxidoreductase, partial [Ignavibacteria bacterium]|nr:Gfo/Idh/MocA family oxidoreductase [Ignavibacteria bacterium]